MVVGLSIRDYAAHRRERGLPGGSKTAVERAIKLGRITRTAAGKIDPTRADAEWAANSDPVKQAASSRQRPAPAAAESSKRRSSTGSDVAASDYARHRARRERAMADEAELEVAVRAGELVEKAKVKAAAWKAGRQVQERMLAIPSRVAAIVAAESDPTVVENLLMQELRGALAGIADG